MSDLRTRIAAAIYEASDEYTRKLMVNPRLPGCDDVEGDNKPICFVLADAVIRELGLREERTASESITNEQGATWHRKTGRRYVTEWSNK